MVSGSSIYYNFDSDGDEEGLDSPLGEDYKANPLEMTTLAQRTEMIKDLEYNISFNIYDEANVAQWRGRDLRQATYPPNIDILLLAIKKDCSTELVALLDPHSGLMGYIGKFWRGFFPLLIVELENTDGESGTGPSTAALQESPSRSNAYSRKMEQLRSLFGEVLTIQLGENEVFDQMDWVHECLARLFLHTRIYQCARFFGSDVIPTMHLKCPGGCGLRKMGRKVKSKTSMNRRRSKFKAQFCDV